MMGGDRKKKGVRETEKLLEAEEFDLLTGVWNKIALEKQIDSCMIEGGALFLCDVDNMKQINYQYGHLSGDEYLKRTAKTLQFLIRGKDILGRTGGDEFAVFMPGCEEEETVQEIRERIEKRFWANRSEEENILPAVSVGVALYQKGDTRESLFERAGKELQERQKQKRAIASGKKYIGKDNYKKDVRQVRQDLMEQIKKPGAYCRDYETFKSIYRFLERGIIRSRQKACVILISIVDEEGNTVFPYKKDLLMEELGEEIHTMLRIGDIYTRYGSSQYLMFVIDTTGDQADMIAEHVKTKFLADKEEHGLLLHYCYELQPAKIGG